MTTKLNANVCDRSTIDITLQLREPVEKLSLHLSQNFGGVMENLWIDYELSQMGTSHRPPFKFRFQKRVSEKSQLIGETFPDHLNVGHYSVRPNFTELLESTDAVAYSLRLIYNSTEILIEKEKKLEGFNAKLFRTEFITGCKAIGYKI